MLENPFWFVDAGAAKNRTRSTRKKKKPSDRIARGFPETRLALASEGSGRGPRKLGNLIELSMESIVKYS